MEDLVISASIHRVLRVTNVFFRGLQYVMLTCKSTFINLLKMDLELNAVMEEMVIRNFRRQVTGYYRVLTFMDFGIV